MNRPARPSGSRWALLLALGLLGSCSQASPEPPAIALEEGEVARVGRSGIAPESIARIAVAQGIEPARALDLAIFDALVAEEAKLRLSQAALAKAEARVGSAVMLARLAEEADAAGPPSDEELTPLVQRDFLRVNRPESVALVHAIVMVPPNSEEAVWTRASTVAQAIADACAPAAKLARDNPRPPFVIDHTPPPDLALAKFLELSQTVDKDGFVITPQALPPITEANQALMQGGTKPMDPDFVRGSFKLERGETALVRSPFGVHVVLSLGRIPAAILDPQELRRHYEAEVNASRVASLADQLAASHQSVVQIEPNADELIALIELGP